MMSFTLMASTELTLKFDCEKAKQEWITWYLDKGGEDLAGYYVVSWDDGIFDLVNNQHRKPIQHEALYRPKE